MSDISATNPLIGTLYIKKDGLAQAYRSDMTAQPSRWPERITLTMDLDG